MASTTDQDVLIRIVTAYEKGGIEEAKKEAAALKKEVDANSSAGQTLESVSKGMETNARQAAGAFKDLSNAMKGGEGALQSAGQAAQKFGSMLGVGGPVMIGIGIVVQALQAWQSKMEEQARKVEEFAQRCADELDKIRQVKFDESVAQIKAMAGEIDAATKSARDLDTAMAGLEDAQLGAALAGIDAQLATETDPQKIFELNQQKAQLKYDAEIKKMQGQIDAMQREIDDADSKTAGVQAELDYATKRRDMAGTRNAAWLQEEQDKEAELAAAYREAEKARLQTAAGHSPFSKAYRDADKVAADAEKAWQDQREKIPLVQHQINQETTARNVAVEAAQQAVDQYAKKAEDIRALRTIDIQAARTRMDTATTQHQTAQGIASRANDARIANDAQAKADEAAAKAEAAAHPPRALSREVGGMVGIGQRDARGQLYDVDVDGGAVRRQAMGTLKAAVDSAVASKGGDAEEAGIIAQAVDALESMGANLLADKQQINAKLQELVNAIQKVEQQVKNGRN